MILTDCWRYVIPGLCSIVLFALDLSLYCVGLSWTPFHYESLAPMLAFSAFVGRWRWASATAALLVFGTTSLLFFSFRLSWQLAPNPGYLWLARY